MTNDKDQVDWADDQEVVRILHDALAAPEIPAEFRDRLPERLEEACRTTAVGPNHSS